MITIAIRFPAGRYHSTPWGSHVNEGLGEWPPSPWRVLRALLATGFTKLGWQSVPADAQGLVGRLAETLPEYCLPAGQLAHSRHYMPVIEGSNQTTSKVLDTFVRLPADEPLLIRFPVQLSQQEHTLLETLLGHLSYLGRAESWTEAELSGGQQEQDNWCTPCVNGAAPPPGGDQVPLLAPLAPAEYAQWRQQAVENALQQETQQRDKELTKAQRTRLLAAYPADLMECLLAETAFHQQYGWSQPPGSRRVLYHRPPGTLEPRPPRGAMQVGGHRPVEAALLALTSETVQGNTLPLMTRCLPVAEKLHESLASILGKKMAGVSCPVLRGCDHQGRTLNDGHRHAHYLPLDLDQDGRLDHVLIYAPMRLDAVAQQAISRLTKTWSKGIRSTIKVTCIGLGDLELFRRQLRTGQGQPVHLLSAAATTWSSATPYVPPRHLKPHNGKYTIEDDVRTELGLRGLPEPQAIEVFNQQGQAGREELVRRRFLHFVRTRDKKKPQPPRRHVFGLRLHFAQPLPGPLALGYASHYGLGLFAAEP